MTVLITLTLAGVDVGPFNIYSNVDGYTTPVATGISRAALIAGYYATVPDGTVEILVQSTGTCTTQLYLSVSGNTTTTTSSTSSTTTTTTTVTATLTVSYSKYSSSFTLLSSIPAPQSLVISGAITADGYPTNACTGAVAGASLAGNLLAIPAGGSVITHAPSFSTGTWSTSLSAAITDVLIPLSINGAPATDYSNGSTFLVGGVLYTFYIVTECV
jgi:hypothetical protein